MRLRSFILAAGLSLWAAPAFSQGCAMCASYAKSSSKEGQRAINKGVLLLVVPPAAFMSLGIAVAFRYGRKRDLEQI
jgi:Na+-translocating ferredoxin:NAD+ oxidoreductase RnfE subunit